jgi:hypothetical protein
VIAAIGAFLVGDRFYQDSHGAVPTLTNIWYLSFFVPFLCGVAVTGWAGGLRLWKRIVTAAVCGAVVGIAYGVAPAVMGADTSLGEIVTGCVWRAFGFTIFAATGAIWAELRRPDPDLQV